MKSMTEVIVTFGTAAILLLIVLGAACRNRVPNWAGWNREAAEEHAAEWGEPAGLELVSCGSADTDGDGYVSCTFRDEAKAVATYECAGWTLITPHDGCREPKVKVQVRQ